MAELDPSKYDATQIELMNEKCLVVDEQDRVLSYDSKKNCHTNSIIKEKLHRAFSIFLFNSKGELLLQKRADEKITFPSHWTNTVCSHPLYFEREDGSPASEQPELEEENAMGVKRAAKRKLLHELGIDYPNAEDFKFLTRIHYLAPSDGIWGEHEIDYILFLRADVEVNPNPNEASEVKWVTADQLRAFIASSQENNLKITPWFKLIVENFIYKWWESLENLDELADVSTIHKMV